MAATRSGSSRSPASARRRGPVRSNAPPRSPQNRRTTRLPRPVTTVAGGDRTQPRLTGRGVVFALVLAMLLVSYASSLRAWLDQRSELATLQSQIAERRAAVAALEEEIQRWRDPAYVESQARERFGWVMPGEVGYRVIGADGKPLGGPDALLDAGADSGRAPRDWWAGLWGSVQAAGREPDREPSGRRSPTPAKRIGPGTPAPAKTTPGPR